METLLQLLKNIKHGWITTLIGSIIAIATFVCVYHPAINWDWERAYPALIIASILLVSPNPPDSKGGMAACIGFLFCFLLMTFCTKPPVSVKETITIKEVPVFVKGDTVKTQLNMDSLLVALRALKAMGHSPKVIYRKGETRLIYQLDSTGNLNTLCLTQDQLITTQQKEIERLSNTREVVEKTPQWLITVAIAEAVFIILLLVSTRLKLF